MEDEIKNFEESSETGSNNCYAALDQACTKLATIDKKFIIIYDDLEQVCSLFNQKETNKTGFNHFLLL